MSPKTLLASLLLALASLAAVPSASALEVQPVLPVCVPPASGNGVCVGTIGGNPCVWSWLGPSFNAVCLDREPADLLVCDNDGCWSARYVVGSSIQEPDPVCVPPASGNGVCVGFIGGDLCVWSWLGPSFNAVCVDDEGLDVLRCDNSGCASILRVTA